MTDQELRQIAARLRNRTDTAEGGIVPPVQVGATRVPPVTNLQLVSRVGGTYTLSWTEPMDPTIPVDHYHIYVMGNNGFNFFATAFHSPAKVVFLAPTGTNLTFQVQSVLASGLICALSQCPTTTAVAP